MKNKINIVSIALFCSAVILLVSCGKQSNGWKGTIEEVDGIIVVKNPREPMYGNEVFSVEEDLKIGEIQGNENYMFNVIRYLAVDDEERIYVRTWERPDNGEGYFFDIFDNEGKYIARIPFNFRPRVLKKGKIYSIEEDEEGYQFVKRYKVNWKN